MDKPEKFRGALVAGPWTSGVFWDRVNVTRDRIHLNPWLRRKIVLDRHQVQVIEFESVRLPLWWTTNVRFLLVDGTMAPKLFNPASTRRFRQALESHDWPTTDRAFTFGHRHPPRSRLDGSGDWGGR